MQKSLSHIGIVGLGVMGSALARNMADHEYRVSVYNRNPKKTKAFLKNNASELFFGAKTYKAFVASLARPRKIMMMVTAGPAVDAVIASLVPHLSKGDIIIDGGNSHYRDTERRALALEKKKVAYLGCGVSGGEEGALRGPSLMIGGPSRAWRSVRPIFETIAARDFSGGPCAAYFGDFGAGHYVKMVHNGIEYGIMQMIAETYSLFRTGYQLPAEDIAEIFARYNRGKLQSFLFEIAVPVLSKGCEPDNDSSCLIYRILDTASQKGTGKWASIDALDRGVAIPTITEAVFARYISGEKQTRVLLDKQYSHAHKRKKNPSSQYSRRVGDALWAAIMSVFAQGFFLIARAAAEEKWRIAPSEVARVWQGGCIIRTKVLQNIEKDYRRRARARHMFFLPSVREGMKKNAKQLRWLVGSAGESGLPLSGFSSALFYFESFTEKQLPANIIQGLRDYFGAHGYQRTDRSGMFHTDWQKG